MKIADYTRSGVYLYQFIKTKSYKLHREIKILKETYYA